LTRYISGAQGCATTTTPQPQFAPPHQPASAFGMSAIARPAAIANILRNLTIPLAPYSLCTSFDGRTRTHHKARPEHGYFCFKLLAGFYASVEIIR
jgi:hypothetical protein